jgi:predicted ATP-grasp superfamily ATP-dependent carboligase
MAGYDVEVLRIFQVKPKRSNVVKRYLKPDAYSKYIKAYRVCVSKRKSKRIVNKLIALADRNNKMLLIPADDLVAHIADEYYNKLSNYYLMPNVNDTQGEIGMLMEKGVQKSLAKEAGLPVLNSCVITAYKGEFEIPDTVTYPCFMKPNISRNSSKGKMRKCESEEELAGYLTEFSKRKEIEMLVEDFVEIDKEYSILGVSTKKGVIGPGFFVAEEGGQKEHRGVAVVGRTLPCSQEQELIDDILKFIQTLKFDGLYDVDLIKTTDGKMYFVELNMRFGASGYAFTECGANLPGMFADYMFFNKPIDLNCKVDVTDKTFVSEKVLIEEYMNGRISFKKLKEHMQNNDIYFVKNDDDPKAYEHFKKYYGVAKIMRRMYFIKTGIQNFKERVHPKKSEN